MCVSNIANQTSHRILIHEKSEKTYRLFVRLLKANRIFSYIIYVISYGTNVYGRCSVDISSYICFLSLMKRTVN